MKWKEKEGRGCCSFGMIRDLSSHFWVWMKGAQEWLEKRPFANRATSLVICRSAGSCSAP